MQFRYPGLRIVQELLDLPGASRLLSNFRWRPAKRLVRLVVWEWSLCEGPLTWMLIRLNPCTRTPPGPTTNGAASGRILRCPCCSLHAGYPHPLPPRIVQVGSVVCNDTVRRSFDSRCERARRAERSTCAKRHAALQSFQGFIDPVLLEGTKPRLCGRWSWTSAPRTWIYCSLSPSLHVGCCVVELPFSLFWHFPCRVSAVTARRAWTSRSHRVKRRQSSGETFSVCMRR